MKFSSIAICLGAASVVSARVASTQDACSTAVAAIPACGTPCINTAVLNYCTSTTDYSCECADATFTALKNSATSCVIAACGLATAGQVLTAVNAVCAACA
ncbi:hypothetical protein DSL72_009435 [Monilinia vaccinii-corymbosi]|uniref:CFEM domain-containing protein n=1 Tax=Monilinia vaccinii-corymbosi TaxID=61207 RepID=A0A8A3PPB3_9HELO|nr:hypothetical protein DSL72_009435 [Monilinia vaccinii-corymbosi]